MYVGVCELYLVKTQTQKIDSRASENPSCFLVVALPVGHFGRNDLCVHQINFCRFGVTLIMKIVRDLDFFLIALRHSGKSLVNLSWKVYL